ncbi:hypothetical protein RFI_34102, partial [Reticulomyxa filosa]
NNNNNNDTLMPNGHASNNNSGSDNNPHESLLSDDHLLKDLNAHPNVLHILALDSNTAHLWIYGLKQLAELIEFRSLYCCAIFYIVLYCIALYCIVLYCIVLCCDETTQRRKKDFLSLFVNRIERAKT